MTEKIYAPSDAKLAKFALDPKAIATDDSTIAMIRSEVASGEMSEARACLGLMILKQRGMQAQKIAERTGIKHSALTERITIGLALARTGDLSVIQIVRLGKLSQSEVEKTTKSHRSENGKLGALRDLAFRKQASKKIADTMSLPELDEIYTATVEFCEENEEPTGLDYVLENVAFVASGLGYQLKSVGRSTDGPAVDVGPMGIEYHMKKALKDCRAIMADTPAAVWELTADDILAILRLLEYVGITDLEDAAIMADQE